MWINGESWAKYYCDLVAGNTQTKTTQEELGEKLGRLGLGTPGFIDEIM